VFSSMDFGCRGTRDRTGSRRKSGQVADNGGLGCAYGSDCTMVLMEAIGGIASHGGRGHAVGAVGSRCTEVIWLWAIGELIHLCGTGERRVEMNCGPDKEI